MDAAAAPWEIGSVAREALVNRAGLRYPEFRRRLRPRYAAAWVRLGAGHAGLIGIAAILVAPVPGNPLLAASVCLLGALGFGYGIAYIGLFFHEAAHYNLAGNRTVNDVMANIFIGSLTGQDIRRYRPVHFQHHRELGMPGDTEISYFDPLDMRFVIESLLGIKAARAFADWDRFSHEHSGMPYLNVQLLLGVLLNVAILASALSLGFPTLAISWSLGILVFFPIFNALRNILEHRSETAIRGTDYRRAVHGAVNRLFGDGLLAQTLGGAGFNRHLLHHWEPQVPFTRLSELQGYLVETKFAPILERHATTYPRTFLRLWRR